MVLAAEEEEEQSPGNAGPWGTHRVKLAKGAFGDTQHQWDHPSRDTGRGRFVAVLLKANCFKIGIYLSAFFFSIFF